MHWLSLDCTASAGGARPGSVLPGTGLTWQLWPRGPLNGKEAQWKSCWQQSMVRPNRRARCVRHRQVQEGPRAGVSIAEGAYVVPAPHCSVGEPARAGQKALAPARALLECSGGLHALHVALGNKAQFIERMARRLEVDHIGMGTARSNSLARMPRDHGVIALAWVPVKANAGRAVSPIKGLGLTAGFWPWQRIDPAQDPRGDVRTVAYRAPPPDGRVARARDAGGRRSRAHPRTGCRARIPGTPGGLMLS